MTFHNGARFSTFDADNDYYDSNCALIFKGGWWYRNCHEANLNGKYGTVAFGVGINWKSWKDLRYSLSASRMMIQKK